MSASICRGAIAAAASVLAAVRSSWKNMCEQGNSVAADSMAAQMQAAEKKDISSLVFRVLPDGSLRKTTVQDIVGSAFKHDVLLLGEVHDDPIAHQLQQTIFKELVENNSSHRRLNLSLEV